MSTRTPVEVTTTYTTTADSLTDAWSFVMDRIDSVGPDPTIEISPVWEARFDPSATEDPGPIPRHFAVVVYGMQQEAEA